METKRIDWIDNLKGLAIILVILGHAGIPFSINKYILSFHMPLFLIISGMLYNKAKYDSYAFKDFFCKKFKELIVPYLWFSLFALIISFVLRLIAFKEIINLSFSILSVLICLNIKNNNMVEMVLWFLPCIFVVELIFFYIVKNKLLYKYLSILLFIFSILGFVESKLLSHIIPFTIDIAITAIVYYGIGFLMKSLIIKYADNIRKNIKMASTIIVVTFIISLICIRLNTGILYMYINQYGNYLLTYIGAIAGSITLFAIAANLPNLKLVSFLGRNTLLIFVVHLKFLFITNKIFNKLISMVHGGFAVQTIASIINTCIITALLIPTIIIINKYMPFLIGKRKTLITNDKVIAQ